ncbi:MAG: response regulator [Acidobacteriaceae bacterium]|nr:response regulator [Acidobacteriaceae bacterium]
MTPQETKQSTRVLVVEDNPMDVRLLRYAMQQEYNWPTETIVVDDGEKAINLLLSVAEGAEARPDFVILDLNLPKRDGTEVLGVIRNTKTLTTLPVAVLSSSPMDVIHDKVNDACLEANCYFTKPMHVDAFVPLIQSLRKCYERGRQAKDDTEQGPASPESRAARN